MANAQNRSERDEFYLNYVGCKAIKLISSIALSNVLP